MIQKKICLLGAFSVGKTSLIQRYVESEFSDKYLTTVGVKISRKQLQLEQQTLSLMLWDIAGQDEFTSIRTAYLRGMAGYILVVDGARPHTCETALGLHQLVQENLGDLPAVIALNKSDLKHLWQLDNDHLQALQQTGHPLVETSAKHDEGVENLFLQLARHMGA